MTEAGSVAMGLIPGVDYSCSGKVRPGVELKVIELDVTIRSIWNAKKLFF